ncbi:MAG TPA: M48 family metallopeptidase [Gammaproteobacteria bacterium]|nr:M48 family metallopeptidase [Gammaproteobacteria bacterium]
MLRLLALLSGLLLLTLSVACYAQTSPAALAAAHTQSKAVPQVLVPVSVPEPTAKAIRYYQSGNVLWTVTTLWSFLVPGIILFTGLSARMRTLASRIGKSWYFTLALYFVLFMLVYAAANLPLDYYADFLRPREYGLSAQSFSGWMANEIIGLTVALVAGLAFLWIPYLLLKRARRFWWLYIWVASVTILVLVVFVQPIIIDPLFNHFGPMQDKALESRVLAEVHRAGVDDAHVYEVYKDAGNMDLDAYVTGIGGSTRIVLSNTIISKLDPDQLLFVVGHETGHYVLGHVWKTLIIVSLLMLPVIWLMQYLADWVLCRWGASTRIGFTEVGDPASLPLFMLLFAVFNFVLTPPLLAYHRSVEHQADRFGLDLTRNNHACASAYLVLINTDLEYPRPGPLYTLLQADHPSTAKRIEFCNNHHPWLDKRHGN